MIDVVHLNRRRALGTFSVERVFDAVRAALPPDIHTRAWECPRGTSGMANRLGNLAAVTRVRGDVLHITGDAGYLALAAARPLVLTIHDLVLLRHYDGWRRRFSRKFWYELPARRSTIVTTISRFTRDEILRETSCPPEKIVVVHNPLTRAVEHSHRPFAPVPKILQIGSNWNKNFVRQTEALAGIPCTVDIVGILSPDHRAALERARVPYQVTYGLSDQEMSDRYTKVDVLLFASTYEGFGLPILEAQSAGVPVITSDAASMPEVAGTGACLVNPLDVADIRRGILRVMNDASYREHIISEGFENVKRFAPPRIAEQFAQIYRGLVDDRGSRGIRRGAAGQ